MPDASARNGSLYHCNGVAVPIVRIFTVRRKFFREVTYQEAGYSEISLTFALFLTNISRLGLLPQTPPPPGGRMDY